MIKLMKLTIYDKTPDCYLALFSNGISERCLWGFFRPDYEKKTKGYQAKRTSSQRKKSTGKTTEEDNT